MRARTDQESGFNFDIQAGAGAARAGQLSVNGTELPTPNLFPVVNFYAGGRERSVFGGGIHRTMKEFMIGADRVGTEPLTDFYDASMMSVSSLTDYNISRETYERYLDTPIKDRALFEPMNGLIFLDSGGFKFLTQSAMDGSGFEVEMNQRSIFNIQKALGGDIIINLDHPIAPDDTHEDRVRKATQTAENIHEFLSLTKDYDGALYLSLHGYNYSMMNEWMDVITDTVPMGILREGFDGIALGGLVPKKDDREALMQAVLDCREFMADWDIEHWPLHILGISSRAIPLLAALGADTFDSSTHLHNAINGKYYLNIMESVRVEDADFSQCDCPVCSSEQLVSQMRGNAEYQKDILGPVAMHNLTVQKRALARLRECIQTGEQQPVIDFLEATFGTDKTMRKFVHQVINEAYGGYF